MGIFDHNDVVTDYLVKEAVEMGLLVGVFKDRWGELSEGKPIVASANVFKFEGEERIREIWNRFVFWQQHVFPKLENPTFFSTNIRWRMVWVFDDGVCFTIIYPEDY